MKPVEQAESLVYEHFTGKCAHDYYRHQYSQNNMEVEFRCLRCDKAYAMPNDGEFPPDRLPPLADSIDAWREIWDAMDDAMKTRYDRAITSVVEEHNDWFFDVPAIHLLIAALRTIGTTEAIELANQIKEG